METLKSRMALLAFIAASTARAESEDFILAAGVPASHDESLVESETVLFSTYVREALIENQRRALDEETPWWAQEVTAEGCIGSSCDEQSANSSYGEMEWQDAADAAEEGQDTSSEEVAEGGEDPEGVVDSNTFAVVNDEDNSAAADGESNGHNWKNDWEKAECKGAECGEIRQQQCNGRWCNEEKPDKEKEDKVAGENSVSEASETSGDEDEGTVDPDTNTNTDTTPDTNTDTNTDINTDTNTNPDVASCDPMIEQYEGYILEGQTQVTMGTQTALQYTSAYAGILNASNVPNPPRSMASADYVLDKAKVELANDTAFMRTSFVNLPRDVENVPSNCLDLEVEYLAQLQTIYDEIQTLADLGGYLLNPSYPIAANLMAYYCCENALFTDIC